MANALGTSAESTALGQLGEMREEAAKKEQKAIEEYVLQKAGNDEAKLRRVVEEMAKAKGLGGEAIKAAFEYYKSKL